MSKTILIFKKKIINLVPRILWWKILAEDLWQKVWATIFKKICHPHMDIFQIPPSKCPCKDFSVSLFLHPNNLCRRKRVFFFLNLKFRVYKSVSFLLHSVSMIMSCHFYRVIFSSLIPCQYDDMEFLFGCRILFHLYHVNVNLLKFN